MCTLFPSSWQHFLCQWSISISGLLSAKQVPFSDTQFHRQPEMAIKIANCRHSPDVSSSCRRHWQELWCVAKNFTHYGTKLHRWGAERKKTPALPGWLSSSSIRTPWEMKERVAEVEMMPKEKDLKVYSFGKTAASNYLYIIYTWKLVYPSPMYFIFIRKFWRELRTASSYEQGPSRCPRSGPRSTKYKNSKSKNTRKLLHKGNKDNLAKTGEWGRVQTHWGMRHRWNKWLVVTGSIQEPWNWDGLSWAEGETGKHGEGPHKPGSQLMMPPQSGRSQPEEEVPGPLSGEGIFRAWP